MPFTKKKEKPYRSVPGEMIFPAFLAWARRKMTSPLAIAHCRRNLLWEAPGQPVTIHHKAQFDE